MIARVRSVGPNWFTTVMGTGIVANAAVTLPGHLPGLRTAATVVWALAALALVGITVAFAAHPDAVRGYAHDPVMVHFYGAPPMALVTVGQGTLLLGRDVLGQRLALDIDWTLWTLGTVAGLATTVVVPYLMLVRRQYRDAFGGWLMPVVPPMVSAAAGALLVPHAPAGPLRLTLLLGCYAMFGMSLLASVVVVIVLCRSLTRHGVGPPERVPALWIVLGPLGQSITAVNVLADVAPTPDRGRLGVFALCYGLPVWALAVTWAVFAGTVTVRTARTHLPFTLAWWAFTFPVGTCVTGTNALGLRTGAVAFRWAAVAFYVGLVAAWATVSVRTVADTARC